MLARTRTNEATFAAEPLAGILESGLEALLDAHWAEVAHDKDLIALAPDWDEYLALERSGKFIGYTLRRNGTLIGYNAFFVLRSMHYKAHVFAQNDVIYLRPEERGLDGIALVVNAERALKAMGVTKVFYHTKADAHLGSRSGDSLEAIEHRLELETLLDIDLTDQAFDEADTTLGGALRVLGYGHVENHFGKLLKEKV